MPINIFDKNLALVSRDVELSLNCSTFQKAVGVSHVVVVVVVVVVVFVVVVVVNDIGTGNAATIASFFMNERIIVAKNQKF